MTIENTSNSNGAERATVDRRRAERIDALDVFYASAASAEDAGSAIGDLALQVLAIGDGRIGAVAWVVEVSGASRPDVAEAICAGLDAVVVDLERDQREERATGRTTYGEHAVDLLRPAARGARAARMGADGDPEVHYVNAGGDERESMLVLIPALVRDLMFHEDEPAAWHAAYEVALAIGNYSEESLDTFLRHVVTSLARSRMRRAVGGAL